MGREIRVDPGAVVVALDVALRCVLIGLAGLLLIELVTETIEPNADGPTPQLLALLPAAYLVWSVAAIRWWVRAARAGLTSDRSFLVTFAIVVAARIPLLRFVAGDVWYRHRLPLAALTAATVVVTVLALAEAARLALERTPAPDTTRRRRDQV